MATDITTVIVVAGVGLFTSVLMGSLAYLAKGKLESIESDIRELDNKMEKMKSQTRAEHQVSAEWMSRITEALMENGIKVNKPDEISETIEVDESD